MQATRTPALLRTAATLLGAMLLVPMLTACPKGDVGAPCNHGDVDPPDSKVVTFPALSCNDLLCVYADDAKAPAVACTGPAECNAADSTKQRFACDNGTCKLNSTYVLERSMCSRTCETSDDCKDGGLGKQVRAKDTNCDSGFECVQIQKLGEFCCQKLCVCSDDLSAGTVDTLATECMALIDPATGECKDNNVMPATSDPTTMTTAG